MIDICINIGNERLFDKRHELLKHAESLGVTGFAFTGTSPESTLKARLVAEEYPTNAVFTGGCHPHGARNLDDEGMAVIRAATEHQSFSMIGECGLDFDRMFSPKEKQIEVFDWHIALSNAIGKPLFLHERNAINDFLASCKKATRGGIVHCFTGDRKTAYRYLDAGFDIGITGWITDDRRNHDLLDALPHLPLDRIHLETDSPYLTPRNIKARKQDNEPANLGMIAKFVAAVIGIDENDLREKTRDNSAKAFGFRPEKNRKPTP